MTTYDLMRQQEQQQQLKSEVQGVLPSWRPTFGRLHPARRLSSRSSINSRAVRHIGGRVFGPEDPCCCDGFHWESELQRAQDRARTCVRPEGFLRTANPPGPPVVESPYLSGEENRRLPAVAHARSITQRESAQSRSPAAGTACRARALERLRRQLRRGLKAIHTKENCTKYMSDRTGKRVNQLICTKYISDRTGKPVNQYFCPLARWDFEAGRWVLSLQTPRYSYCKNKGFGQHHVSEGGGERRVVVSSVRRCGLAEKAR